MTGVDRLTGRLLSGAQHLAQSVADILTTPVGTRCGRREYGSDLPGLVDAPLNPLTRLRLFAATAVALARWEPRLQLTRVGLTVADAAAGAAGQAQLTITGVRTDTPTPQPFSASVPLQLASA